MLTAGTTAFQPGLLAAAHRGVLYVDEVNLLHDHLVDLLLDAAALGVNYVEREGVSVRHASRFLLVGTMNPEEGELRPQLLDRFGLTVQVTASQDPAERAEVRQARLRSRPRRFRPLLRRHRGAGRQVAAARDRLPGRPAGRRAAPDLRGVRRVRRGRHARQPGHRADRDRPGRLARTRRGDGGGHPHRGPAGPAAPPPPRPLRRPRPGRAGPRRRAAGSSSEAVPPEPPAPRRRPAIRTAPTPRARRPGRRPGGPSGPGGLPEQHAHRPSSPVSPQTPRRARQPHPRHRSAPGCSPCPGSARARRAAAPRPAGRSAAPSAPASRRTVRSPCTSPPPSAPPRCAGGTPPGPSHLIVNSSGQIAPETAHDHEIARPAQARRVTIAPADLREAVREGREGGTWCSSPWTPAGRWRPGSGCARSRARSCPCCSTRTSAGTRWAWSRSAARRPRSRCRRPPRWRPRPAA